MLKTYHLIWGLLIPAERLRFVGLIFVTILSSIVELFGVAGILPFLSVLSDPTLFETNPLLQWYYQFYAFETAKDATVMMGGMLLLLIVTSMAIRAGVTYVQIRFGLMRGYTLSARLLQGYLQQEYVFHLSRNTSDLGQTLLSEVDAVVRGSILPAILVITHVLTVLYIGALLFFVEPYVALGATGVLMGTYLSVALFFRRRLTRTGERRVEANGARFKVVQEVSGGLKEIKFTGLEQTSLKRFRAPARELAQHQTSGQTISRLPRYVLEATAYSGFIIMILLLILIQGQSMGSLVPLLGLIGMSAGKLFPALQQMFQQISTIQFTDAALERLSDRLHALNPPQPVADAPALRLTTELQLDQLRYRYPSGEKDTLNGLSARIPAHTTVGIVGGTGAGKTTVIDLILGLLRPDQGTILVDGTPITDDSVRGWQKAIGYVPQTIFLTDDSVASNIAFGLGSDQVDHAAVERAARIANLHDFVISELPDGYDTLVGERGVRLSGGQRQRIGIARALYHDPDLLILDEATSALDNVTERAVMDAVHALGQEKTIVMIAHRLSTVEACDTIFVLEHGQIAAQGNYDTLIAKNALFQKMANC